MSEAAATDLVGHEQQPLRTSESNLLEVGVKVFPLVVLLLPLIGIGIRWMAFGSAGIRNALDLAADDSVAELAIAAVNAVGFAVLTYSATGFIFRNWLLRPSDAAPRSKTVLAWPRPSAYTWRAWVVLALWTVLVAFTASWPGGLFLQLAALWSGLSLGSWNFRHDVTFYRVATLVVVVAGLYAFSAGLDGTYVGNQINDYRFESGSRLTDGRYVLLGQADDVVYLDSCQGSGVQAIRQQNIVDFHSLVPTETKSPTIAEILITGASPRIGYRRRC